MPHCRGIGCTTDRAVEKVLSGKDPEDLYWVVHVKTFYEIYKCYVANKKNLCQCRYNGKRKIFQCSYCVALLPLNLHMNGFMIIIKQNTVLLKK